MGGKKGALDRGALGDQEVRLPEMVRALALPEAAARHHADSRFLEEPQAVQHVRLHSQSLHTEGNRSLVARVNRRCVSS